MLEFLVVWAGSLFREVTGGCCRPLQALLERAVKWKIFGLKFSIVKVHYGEKVRKRSTFVEKIYVNRFVWKNQKAPLVEKSVESVEKWELSTVIFRVFPRVGGEAAVHKSVHNFGIFRRENGLCRRCNPGDFFGFFLKKLAFPPIGRLFAGREVAFSGKFWCFCTKRGAV